MRPRAVLRRRTVVVQNETSHTRQLVNDIYCIEKGGVLEAVSTTALWIWPVHIIVYMWNIAVSTKSKRQTRAQHLPWQLVVVLLP